ncbi:MAG TPA: phosphoribosyltransferase [Pyrodictium sp.]|nr:phosphoribosyltransferase [Pyrodictium sp.]
MSELSCRIEQLNGCIYCSELSERAPVFHDRLEAGRLLGSFIKQVLGPNSVDVVFGLAAGGVPVAFEVSRATGACLDIIVVKKITFPWTTEAGFGAVAIDGSFEYDEKIAHDYLGYDYEAVKALVDSVRKYVFERTLRLRGDALYPRLEKQRVLLVDDGIATGYTMVVGVKFLRRLGAEQVVAAAPTASVDGAMRVSRVADQVVVLNLRGGAYYAVADAYVEWHDVCDDEVMGYLEKAVREGIACTWVSR